SHRGSSQNCHAQEKLSLHVSISLFSMTVNDLRPISGHRRAHNAMPVPSVTRSDSRLRRTIDPRRGRPRTSIPSSRRSPLILEPWIGVEGDRLEAPETRERVRKRAQVVELDVKPAKRG